MSDSGGMACLAPFFFFLFRRSHTVIPGTPAQVTVTLGDDTLGQMS
jgi:hypothetical protein